MAGNARLHEPPRSGPLTHLTEPHDAARAPGGVPPELLASLEAAAGGGLLVFVPGSRDLDDLQTLAGLAVLRRLAGPRRGPGVRILVAAASPLVARAADAILAGTPGARTAFLSGDPVGFAAGAAALIRRTAPRAVHFAGAFSGEALLLLEAAAGAGALSSGGTARLAAAPLFRIGADRPIGPERIWDAAAGIPGADGAGAASRARDAGLALLAAALAAGALAATLRSPAGERLGYALRGALAAAAAIVSR